MGIIGKEHFQSTPETQRRKEANNFFSVKLATSSRLALIYKICDNNFLHPFVNLRHKIICTEPLSKIFTVFIQVETNLVKISKSVLAIILLIFCDKLNKNSTS